MAVYTDDFNRANANPIGSPWATLNVSSWTSAMRLHNNAMKTGSWNVCGSYYTTQPGANQYSQAWMLGGESLKSIIWEFWVRYSTGNGYLGRFFDEYWASPTSNCYIAKIINGTYTALAETRDATPNKGLYGRLSIIGSTLTLSRGVDPGSMSEILSVDSGGQLSSGYVGCGAWDAVQDPMATLPTLENWSGGDMSNSIIHAAQYQYRKRRM